MRFNRYFELITWITLIGGIVLAGVGLYKFGFAENSDYAILMLVIGLVMLTIGIVLFVINERNQRKKKSIKEKPTRQQRSVNYSIRTQLDDEKPMKKGKLIASIVDYPVVGEVCMISKLPIEDDDNVLQCPFCSSYFIKKYLEEWTKNNKTCPVCKSIILEE
ncbi:MAG: hypothetical protein HZR80_10285 [Candidatus Heimdallarchaeota archaeon]